MVVRVVVGAPAVVVHLHEVGLGLLVDLRPTDPSLATLAVDGQALLLDEETPNQFLTDLILLEWEGAVVMVIHSLPLTSSPHYMGKERGCELDWFRLSKGRCPPLLEWEGVVVMVIQSLLPKVCPVPLGIGRGGGHGHTQPSSQKLSSSYEKGKGW